MVENLNKKKVPKTLDILETATYINSDIVCLQEVASSFISQARDRPKLDERFWFVAPSDMDAVRDQNSVIFLSKSTFPNGSNKEITPLVESSFDKGIKVPIAKGDILAVTATDKDGVDFVIASFHGDTNGLATKPVLDAIFKAMSSDSTLVGHNLIFGLDANTYEKAKPGKQQDVLDFGKHYVALGLSSCWGDIPDPQNYTTFNSRTYLQVRRRNWSKSSFISHSLCAHVITLLLISCVYWLRPFLSHN